MNGVIAYVGYVDDAEMASCIQNHSLCMHELLVI